MTPIDSFEYHLYLYQSIAKCTHDTGLAYILQMDLDLIEKAIRRQSISNHLAEQRINFVIKKLTFFLKKSHKS